MKKSQFINLLFVGLFFISGTLIAQPRDYCRDHNRAGLRSIERLELTTAQREKLDNLRYEHKQKAIELKAAFEQNRLAIQKMFSDDNINENKIVELTEENSAIKADLAMMKIEMRLTAHSILTDEQKAELKSYKNDFRGKRFGKGHRSGFRQMNRNIGECRRLAW